MLGFIVMIQPAMHRFGPLFSAFFPRDAKVLKLSYARRVLL